jgi:hypothetical protein
MCADNRGWHKSQLHGRVRENAPRRLAVLGMKTQAAKMSRERRSPLKNAETFDAVAGFQKHRIPNEK